MWVRMAVTHITKVQSFKGMKHWPFLCSSFLFMFLPTALHLSSHSYCTAPRPLFCPLCCSSLLFCGGRAAAVSQPVLLPLGSCCRDPSVLPLPLLPLFVIHCVVTLIIMDSAQVFRLSAGSWSPPYRTLFADMRANLHGHAHVQYSAVTRSCANPHTCRALAHIGHKTHTHHCNAHFFRGRMMTLFLPLRCERVLALPESSVCSDL